MSVTASSVNRWFGVALLTGLVASACRDDDSFGQPDDCASVESQNIWIDNLMREVYLWNDALEIVDPAAYETPRDFLVALRVGLDRWSYINTIERNDAYYEEGMFLGLGYKTVIDSDRRRFVSFVYPDSPASAAGVNRGDEIRAVDGTTAAELDRNGSWSSAYGPNEPGVRVDMTLAKADGTEQDITLTKDWVPITTVPVHRVLRTSAGPVGYLAFLAFVETAYDELDEAFAEFAAEGVDQVVVDLRYNGGGRLAVAKYFGELLTGRALDGEIMYRVEHNDHMRDWNENRRFQAQANSIEATKVTFLTTRGTASASELLINALIPHLDVEVVGSTTAGKPVGMYAWEFCDQVIHPISFRMVNDDGATDYFDGLAVDCPALDDLSRDLGDPAELSLAAALARTTGASCPDPQAEPKVPEELPGFAGEIAAR